METYKLLDKDNISEIYLGNTKFDGNLFIENTKYKLINLENCYIEGDLIIDSNKSIIELTGSIIKGSIIVNYVKDGQFLHFDKLNCGSNQPLINDNDNSKRISEFISNKNAKICLDENAKIYLNEKGQIYLDKISLAENSLVIINSQIKLNLDSSIFKGDVYIHDSTIAEGTFDMSKAQFGTKDDNNKFEIISTGIASDIEAKETKFYGDVKFEDIRFDNEIYFNKSNFSKKVEFIDCTMYQECYLEDAIFNSILDISETVFQGKVSFKGIEWVGNSYFRMSNGSAFLGYVDMKDEYLENYLFINVRGLRNIFYSLLNSDKSKKDDTEGEQKGVKQNLLKFLYCWSKNCQKSYEANKIGINNPNLIIKLFLKVELGYKKSIKYLNSIIKGGNDDEDSCQISDIKYKDDYTLNVIDIEIEMYIEARRAMEDMAREELISECHILEMEAQRRKAENSFVKWFRYTFLKYTTNYGESPFRIFRFIIFDWLFFSFLYWLIIKGHEIFGSSYPYSHDKHYCRSYIEALYHSAENLLSLNLNINNDCCIYIIIVTLLQGFINIMIIALMTQVVFRKLDLR